MARGRLSGVGFTPGALVKARVKYVPNPNSTAALGLSQGMARIMELRGAAAAQIVREIGPVDPKTPDGEHYVDQITSVVGIRRGKFYARVNANKWTSGLIEFGTGGSTPTPAFAPLRRAVELLGLVVIGRRGRRGTGF